MTLRASIKSYYDKKIAERQTHYHSLGIAPANLPESSEICWLRKGNGASANGAIYQYSLNAKAASSHICHHTSSCSRLLLKPPRKIWSCFFTYLSSYIQLFKASSKTAKKDLLSGTRFYRNILKVLLLSLITALLIIDESSSFLKSKRFLLFHNKNREAIIQRLNMSTALHGLFSFSLFNGDVWSLWNYKGVNALHGLFSFPQYPLNPLINSGFQASFLQVFIWLFW